MFRMGDGPIWIDNLACSGFEENINDCGFLGWGVHNCQHSDDAGVVCVT